MSKLVSIIIPSFNSQEFIAETLDSVMSQTYGNWECIIVDDGSEDGTIGIIQEYCKRDKRFRFYSRHRVPKGASTCRNIGLEKSLGEFIVFLDSDDLLDMNCLDGRIKSIWDNPGYDLWIFPTGHFMKKQGDSPFRWNLLHKELNDLERFILHDNPWCITGPIWKKEDFTKLGGFDEDAICWQDWELHIRMLISRHRYYKAEDSFVDAYYRKCYQSNQNSISSQVNNIRFLEFRIKLFKKFFTIIDETVKPGEFHQAFKVSFWRILNQVGNAGDNKYLIDLLKYFTSINLFNRVEILVFYALFWNIGYRNKLIRLIRNVLRIFLKNFYKNIYGDTRNKDSIYSKKNEIIQMESIIYGKPD